MQAFMKKYRLWPGCVLLLVALCVIGFAEDSLLAIPEHYQYLWPAPAQVEPETAAPTAAPTAVPTAAPTASSATEEKHTARNSGIKEIRGGMETLRTALAGACDPVTLYAVAEGASVSVKDGEPVVARMEAIEAEAQWLRPMTLYTGRLLYPDEFKYGTHVALVDEQLAVALFRYAEPIDREIVVGDESFRIVGIVRDSKRVGDKQAYTFYVPLRAVERSGILIDAMCVEAMPSEGAGGWSAFREAVKELDANGTLINLDKECRNAALPLRILGCVAGLMLVVWLVRLLNGCAGRFYHEYKRRIIDRYAIRLLPWMITNGLLLMLGYAACVAALAEVFVVLVAPVFTFPEWVPAILVEPNDIATAFWNVWQGMASLRELRSPELIRVRFFRELMAWGCGAAALFGGMTAMKLRFGFRQERVTRAAEPNADPDTQEKG